jgi:hypothetical protein
MAAWKCAQCALLNSDAEQTCRRCGMTQAGNGNAYGATYGSNQSTNVPVTPTYGMPQNYRPAALPNVWGEQAGGQAAWDASSGVWSDGHLLVMNRSALLPSRCVKCNAPTNGLSINRTLRGVDSTFGWMRYIPYLRYIYWIARASSDKVAQVALGVCSSHHSNAKVTAIAAVVLRIAGLVLFVYGLHEGEPLCLAGGLILAIVGSVLRGASTIVKVSRMDDYYIWLKGAHPSYLAVLPPVPR